MTGDRSNLVFRIILDILLLIGLFAFPFWLLAVLAFIGLIYFRDFIEFIIVFMFSDFLYAVPEVRFGGSVFVMTIVAVIVYFATDFIKRKILVSKLRNYVS